MKEVSKVTKSNQVREECFHSSHEWTRIENGASFPHLIAKMEGADQKVDSSSGAAKKNPTDFLKQVIGKPVIVKLNSGVTYRGVLACLDGFMNIAMEQTEEYIDGQLKNRYGDCFIRGNNGKSSP